MRANAIYEGKRTAYLMSLSEWMPERDEEAGFFSKGEKLVRVTRKREFFGVG